MRSTQRLRAAVVAGAIAAALGCCGLTGWGLGVDAMGTFGVGVSRMRPVTAVTLVLGSVGLMIAVVSGRRQALRFAGGVLTLGGMLAVTGWAAALALPWWPPSLFQLGLDQLPSLPAGVAFALMGAALLAIDRGRHPLRRLADHLALLSVLLCFTVLTAFAYGVPSFGPLLGDPETGMAFPTALSLLALSCAILLLPERGLVTIVLASPSATLARGVLATAFIAPPLLGLLARAAARIGVRDEHALLAVLIMVTSSITILGVLVGAHRLAESDERRGRAEEELRELVRTAPAAILATANGVVVMANARAAALFDRPVDELTGTRIGDLVPGIEAAACTLEPIERRIRRGSSEVEVELVCTGAERRTLMLRDLSERRRAEIASRRLAAVVESSNDAIITVDSKGLISAWNPAAERLYGWSQAEAIGKDLGMTVPPERAAEVRSVMEALARGEVVPAYETERLRKDGSRFDASITVSAMWDADHELIGYSGIARDISERRRTELALRAGNARFRALFDHSADGVFIADLDGRYVDVNEAGLRMLRASREEVVGRTIADFIPPEDLPRLAAAREEVLAGKRLVSEWPMRRSDGTWATIEVSTCVLPDRRWLGLTRDVTARREAEDALRRLHETERELRRLREEWTAVVAHDLRQPVSSIALSAQALARRSSGDQPEADRQLILRIETAAQRTRRMIDDLLDYAQIEAGRLRIAPQHVDLTHLVIETVDRLAPLTPRHTLRVHADEGTLDVDVDPARLDQVITNLVTNAAKYGDPDTEIEIRLHASDHEVEITVTNHGPCLGEEERARLFDRFYRTSGAARTSIPGLGLGLFIVKGIVEAHGGRIDVESIPGRTTFRVVLPGERHSLAA